MKKLNLTERQGFTEIFFLTVVILIQGFVWVYEIGDCETKRGGVVVCVGGYGDIGSYFANNSRISY